ncbi:MAG: cyclic nucleotide-binding domain-containing protein [Deltaproteobacteria bacterium]|nr:cyclic nucleotide-binding domain-containing protein [Deltaproteobacteria bacterium]
MDLSNLLIFKGLTPELIAEFATACETHRYKAGVDIITKGQKGDLVYFVIKGRLQVFLPDENGDESRVLAELNPGAVFGEMELLTERPRFASVSALTNIKLWAISFDDFRARIDGGDVATLKIMFNIAKILAHRLEAIAEKLSEIGEGRAEVHREELRSFRRKLFSEWDF